MKIIIVGQAPGPQSGRDAFDGRSGDRLARYMGLSDRTELRAKADCLNVLRSYPGPARSKGDAFPVQQARDAARRLTARLRGRRVLLAGKRVSGAFGLRTDYLVWTTHRGGFDVAVIPHPSGINHWWNEPRNRRRFTKFARDVMGRAT